MASTESALMTADQLLRLPDDGMRHELDRGRLLTTEPAGARHGQVAMVLGALLTTHVRAHGLGVTLAAETGFVIASDPDTVRAPDAGFVAGERGLAARSTKGFFVGAPDLAAEVVSPGDSYSEVHAKALEWLTAGTRIVLVVDPERRTVTAYRSADDVRIVAAGEEIDASDVVPGWRFSPGELFD